MVPQISFTRFIAATIVVFYHFGLPYIPTSLTIFRSFVERGNEAVNYFFFLSGYIMVIAYEKEVVQTNKIDALRYLSRRFVRLYPVYLLALLATLLINSYSHSFNLSPQRFASEVLLIQSWLGKSSMNFPGWSLSVELVFYLIFPLLFKFIFTLKTHQLYTLIFILYVLNVIFGFLFISNGSRKIFFFEYNPIAHISTFLNGAIVSTLFIRHKALVDNNKLFFKSLFYILSVLLLIIFSFLKIPHHNNGWLLPVYTFFVLGLSISSTVTEFLSNKFFIWLGNISYALYILQFPLWMLYEKSGIDSFLMYMLLLIASSGLIYRYYEVPAKKILLNRIQRSFIR